MHDIRTIRADPAAFDAVMARRGFPPQSNALLEIDTEKRERITTAEKLQAEKNSLSRRIGELKRASEDSSALEATSETLSKEITAARLYVVECDAKLSKLLPTLPNLLADDVPDGSDETANITLKTVGEPRSFDFSPKEHFDLGEALGMMDFATAGKIAGSRFTILRGQLARLERALGAFMIDLHTERHGYTETAVPLMVNSAAVYGTSSLPKFEEDLFHIDDGAMPWEEYSGRWLIPTAEVPLTNTVAGDILPESRLPIRMAALSDCFRSEAGSAGRDTRGMLRQHQFKKVEMVSICHPDASTDEHERMTRCAEAVLEALELPYRRMLLCAGDTGFGSSKTFDLEVWLPGQNAYREISSCSNMRDFQARRMSARFRPKEGKGDSKSLPFVHTLNGSGVAVGRALIAVLENYQNADGSITVPSALRPYMGGLETIAR